MALGITGMTVSIEFGDTSYGAGTKSFCNLSARANEGDPIPIDDPVQAIEAGLDMYLTAWKTLMMGRFGVGTINKEEYLQLVPIMQERFQKLKVKLHEQQLQQR
jgi:hypothetical protein